MPSLYKNNKDLTNYINNIASETENGTKTENGNQTMKISIVTTSKQGERTFTAKIHKATSPKDFQLDAETFYQQSGGVIPEGVHHELEIIWPDRSFFNAHKLHIHRCGNGQLFVCYPRQIPTPQGAKDIFEIWCVGTMCTIVEKVDLNTLFSQECEDDPNKFFAVASERHGIRIISSEFDE